MTTTCAAGSRDRCEAPGGTASRARRWILLEQPGAWGADALTESDLPAVVAAHLQRLAIELPARVLLLRRTGGEARLGEDRTLFVGRSTPDGGWLERHGLAEVRDLLDLDLSGVAGGNSTGGERVTDPLYLVCTNGKHDACCATFGLPVSRALLEVVGDRLWECSHVGGDRFAGNLVCLPEGVFYGHLDPDSARRAVAAHEGGRLLLDHWRGRSALPFAAQAAEALVRRELSLERLASLRVTAVERDAHLHTVRLVGPDGGTVTATVRAGHDKEPAILTCGTAPRHAPTFELVALETTAPPIA